MNWTTKQPSEPGKYKIRPFKHEKFVVGSEEITGEQEVAISYLKGRGGLHLLLHLAAIELNGLRLEFLGPLEPPA